MSGPTATLCSLKIFTPRMVLLLPPPRCYREPVSRETIKAGKTHTRRALPRRAGPPHPGRHARKCCICRHRRRDAIEAAFLDWSSPTLIADKYRLPGRNPLYRHAHATGLWARRKRNVGVVLEGFLEQADQVKVTASAIVRAVRTYAHINDAGEWIEHRKPNRDTRKLENEPTR